jgi:hypothetical protein
MNNVTLVAKDNCGHVLKTIWTNTYVPAVAATVTISGKTCTGFNASVTGQQTSRVRNTVYSTHQMFSLLVTRLVYSITFLMVLFHPDQGWLL